MWKVHEAEGDHDTDGQTTSMLWLELLSWSASAKLKTEEDGARSSEQEAQEVTVA